MATDQVTINLGPTEEKESKRRKVWKRAADKTALTLSAWIRTVCDKASGNDKGGSND